MKKLFKILLILLLITILGVGGLFTYLKFFKEKEPTEPKVEITYNEDVGSLINTLTQIEQTVSSENSLTVTKSNEKIIVKTMNDGFRNVESEIIYVTTFNNTNKSLLPYIEKYFNVDETYLILADIDNRLVNDSFNEDWYILNDLTDGVITVCLSRKSNSVDYVYNNTYEYKDETGNNVVYAKNYVDNVDMKYKKGNEVISFSLTGTNVDNVQITQIDELFDGKVLFFINDALERYNELEIFNNKKEYSDIYDCYYINIVGDYSTTIERKDITILVDVVELMKKTPNTKNAKTTN